MNELRKDYHMVRIYKEGGKIEDYSVRRTKDYDYINREQGWGYVERIMNI